MINFPMDEARGFDELSIATLKALNSYSAVEGYLTVVNAMYDALGPQKMDEVMASPEYLKLLELNRKVFEAINRLAAEGEHPGDYIEMNGPNGLNHQRWEAKRALQAKFFPNSPLTERKVGYREDKV